MKALKWALIGLGSILLIAMAIVGVLVATFDPNDYTPWIVERVKRDTGRTLSVHGTIGLAFFPGISATVGRVTLSEPHSPVIFARVDAARIGLALWPLLSRQQVVVDRVILDGLMVELVRHRDGRTNFDDLTSRASPPGEATGTQPPGPLFAIDVGGIEMRNTTVGWKDEGDGVDIRLSGVAVKTGRLASGMPGALELGMRVHGVRPKLSLDVAVKTAYRLDPAARSVALSSLVANVTGDAPGIIGMEARITGQTVDIEADAPRVTVSEVKLSVKAQDGLDMRVAMPRLLLTTGRAETEAFSADVALATPSRTVSARLQTAPFAVTGTEIHVPRVGVDFTVTQSDLSVNGTLATPVTLDLGRWQAQFSGIVGDVQVTRKNIPDQTRATVSGTARADWSAESAAAELVVKLDDSSIDAHVAVAHWSAPAITFHAAADRLDVDRYFPPSRSAAAPGGVAGGGSALEHPFDLSALTSLNATGQVRIGALRVSGLQAQQVALAVKASGGRLEVNPISATLYQGTLAGRAVISASDSSIAIQQRLVGISLGPLLRDVTDTDRFEGRGGFGLDVRTSGTTVTALRRALAGTVHMALKDGVIKGVDVPAMLRTAQTLTGSGRWFEQKARGGARTDFASFTASFLVKNGVAHSEDLQLTSSGLRLTGRGDIDIGEGTLDVLTKVSVTTAVTSLTGIDLAGLVGVSVPLRATGSLASPTYSVDVQSLATELAKTPLPREIKRRLGAGKSDGQDPGSAAGDAQRRLFGKPK
jgi:AsmA protein